MLGIQSKFQTCEKQKNKENKMPKEKQSHAQDSIYVVRQFAYVYRVVGILLLSKKITMCGYNIFISQKQQQDKTLITKKKNGFYILRTGFIMGYKMGQNFLLSYINVIHTQEKNKISTII